jgi:hypothetical protein
MLEVFAASVLDSEIANNQNEDSRTRRDGTGGITSGVEDGKWSGGNWD